MLNRLGISDRQYEQMAGRDRKVVVKNSKVGYPLQTNSAGTSECRIHAIIYLIGWLSHDTLIQ